MNSVKRKEESFTSAHITETSYLKLIINIQQKVVLKLQ